MKPTYKNTLLMLRESNAIEGEFDRGSLITAHRAWKFLIAQDTLCTECILIAHRILMANHDIPNKYKGEWRDVPVWIGGQMKSQSRPVLQSLMEDYVEDLNHLPEDYLRMHTRFEAIHPFIDGNGRIGRMLLNWHSMKLENKLIVFLAQDKHETYYPIFDNQDRHLQNAYKYLDKEIHDGNYYNSFSFKTRLPRKSVNRSRVA